MADDRPDRSGFRRLLATDTLSVFGDYLLGVALPLYVLDVTGSAAAAAAMALTRAVPIALFGLLGGALADRLDKRRLLLLATAGRAVIAVPLVIPLPEGPRLVVAFGCAFALAVLAALARPAVGASLPLVVTPDELPTTNAKLEARSITVELIAPTAGAVLYAHQGLTGVGIANVAIFGLGLLTALALRIPPQDLAAEHRRSPWAGVAVLRARPELLAVTTAVLISILGMSLQLALLVPYVREVLGGTEASVGVLTSFEAIGGLAGAACVGLWGRRLGPQGLMSVGILSLPISTVTLLLSSSVPQAVPGVMLAGALLTAMISGLHTLIQTTVPHSHLGRVLGLFTALFGAAAVCGAAGATLLVGPLGLHTCLAVAAVIEVTGVVWFYRRRPG